MLRQMTATVDGNFVTVLSAFAVLLGLTPDLLAQPISDDRDRTSASIIREDPETETTPEADVPTTQPAPPISSLPFGEWEQLTGDWATARPWLEDRGLTFEIDYSADFFVNTRGGLDTSDAFAYRGLLNMTLMLDTEAMGLWEGGAFGLLFQNIHGRDISRRFVGDLQALNNADAPDRTQVAEYWYEQVLADGLLRFKLGKLDANADFAYVDYGLEFIHSSPGYPPLIPMPTFPDPALGAVIFVEPVDWFYLGGGVYDALGEGNRWGFETTFHAPDDSFTIFEFGLRPTFHVNEQVLPGTYRVGGWYHSGTFEVFPDASRASADDPDLVRMHRGNAGMYLSFDQLVYREHPDQPDDNQGLGAFFQFAWAPSAYNELSQYYGAGCEYVGLLPTRDEDVTGVGLFHVSLSGRIQEGEDRHSETAIEVFHKIQITPAISVKPEVQYIVNPGGAGRDALVAGMRVEMSF